MPWSGRDALLGRWLGQFHDPEMARHEADKYVQGSYAPDDTRADSWMQRALVHDQDLVAIAADPDSYVLSPSRYDLNDCYHCYGRGFVRLDVEPSHAEFGRAKPCPTCSVRTTPAAQHCPKCAAFATANGQHSERLQCWQCRAFEDEAVAVGCRNPDWHVPGGMPAQTQFTVETVLKRFGKDIG